MSESSIAMDWIINHWKLLGILVVAIATIGGIFIVLVVFVLKRPATVRSAGADPASAGVSQVTAWARPAGVGRCPMCGIVLPSDSPLGLCPQCLLLGAMSRPQPTPQPRDDAETGPYQRPGS